MGFVGFSWLRLIDDVFWVYSCVVEVDVDVVDVVVHSVVLVGVEVGLVEAESRTIVLQEGPPGQGHNLSQHTD